jgi:hypothetical protein
MNATGRKKTKDFNPAKTTKLVKKDAIMELGFGMVAYRDILCYLIVFFLILSLIQLPVMWIYGQGEGFELALKDGSVPKTAQYNLGNLGYSDTHCDQVPTGIGQMRLHCTYGVIGEILDYGINDVQNGIDANYCKTTYANQACKPDNPRIDLMFQRALGHA